MANKIETTYDLGYYTWEEQIKDKTRLVCSGNTSSWTRFSNSVDKLFKEIKDIRADLDSYQRIRIRYLESVASLNELEVDKQFLKQQAFQNKTCKSLKEHTTTNNQ